FAVPGELGVAAEIVESRALAGLTGVVPVTTRGAVRVPVLGAVVRVPILGEHRRCDQKHGEQDALHGVPPSIAWTDVGPASSCYAVLRSFSKSSVGSSPRRTTPSVILHSLM